MNLRPDTGTLLDAARRRLLDEIAPALSGDEKYQALMVGHAIAIALRDLAGTGAPDMAEFARFEQLYGAETVKDAGGNDDERLAALNRRLCTEIRAGRWDQSPHRVMGLLTHQVRMRLARSNPKYLERLPKD